MKKYTLYWKDFLVGSLFETNYDMRSSGTIRFNPDTTALSADKLLLEAYIQHSVIGSVLLEAGDEERYNKHCEDEGQFLAIINSPDWYLVDESGQAIKIRCPIFHENNEISWLRAKS
jgi:hypothetical protein